MRKAKVYIQSIWAGDLIEDEEGYHFQYSENYLKDSESEAVSLTLPLQEEPFHDRLLFPFFDGLIPEGWLLDIAQKNWKLDPRDRMGLLLKTCRDCVGSVSIEETEENNDE